MKKVLIANRGEIARRIMRTCRAMRISTVAVHSDADAGALHALEADQMIAIGPAPSTASYLNSGAILAAARESGADAIHPGYGFLSENAEFAQQVAEAGLIWVGPDSASIRDMGDKEQARRRAVAAGVPVLPASEPFDSDDFSTLDEAAAAIGYPVLVKAAGGGGGIGMRRIEKPADLEAAVMATRGQALRSFGNGKVYLEKFIRHARHIEVQVFGLGDGRAAALGERDCSLQRRFQKVIEEAPSVGIPETLRAAMAEAAVALTGRERYLGAGTVEFVVDAENGGFFFLEMNTRIQVEHGLTELVLGIDLVERQLRLAAGERDTTLLGAPAARGHAIEARVYAERPEKGFLPHAGTLQTLDLPAGHEGLRIDSGLRAGDMVTPYYDPMIAKVMALGSDRAVAIDRLVQALERSRVEGVSTNVPFLIAILRHPAYHAGPVCTDFIESNLTELIAATSPSPSSCGTGHV